MPVKKNKIIRDVCKKNVRNIIIYTTILVTSSLLLLGYSRLYVFSGSLSDQAFQIFVLLIILLLIIFSMMFFASEMFNHIYSQSQHLMGDVDKKLPENRKQGKYHFQELNSILWILKEIDLVKQENEKIKHDYEMKQADYERLKKVTGRTIHDLNNMISSQLCYPDMILSKDEPDPVKIKKAFHLIKENGVIAADLLSDLQYIVKDSMPESVICNLNSLVNNEFDNRRIDYLESAYAGIFVSKTLAKNLPMVMFVPDYVDFILTILVLNGIEATLKTSQTGIVSIKTSLVFHDGKHHMKSGKYSVLSVTDSGPEIKQDELELVCEPFYIKKNLGRSGRGLGLTVIRHLLQLANGYLHVASNELHTEFKCYFPATKEISDEITHLENQELHDHKKRVVLVIEDVDSQREIAVWMLEKLGYHAESVSCGEDAVVYLRQNQADVILLDMIMNPDMGGYETFQEILKIKPEQKAVITSGYTEEADLDRMRELGVTEYLKKALYY